MSFEQHLPSLLGPGAADRKERQTIRWEGEGGHTWPNGSEKSTPEKGPATSVKERFGLDVDPYLGHGSIVIAAITSCTNTSNPSVMIAAGLLAKKAVEKGLTVPPWVKTSLAPGSRVVTDYYQKSGLLPNLSKNCASTLWATDARRALATPGRCRPMFRKALTSTDWLR